MLGFILLVIIIFVLLAVAFFGTMMALIPYILDAILVCICVWLFFSKNEGCLKQIFKIAVVIAIIFVVFSWL